jgi:hypothetical protein
VTIIYTKWHTALVHDTTEFAVVEGNIGPSKVKDTILNQLFSPLWKDNEKIQRTPLKNTSVMWVSWLNMKIIIIIIIVH